MFLFPPCLSLSLSLSPCLSLFLSPFCFSPIADRIHTFFQPLHPKIWPPMARRSIPQECNRPLPMQATHNQGSPTEFQPMVTSPRQGDSLLSLSLLRLLFVECVCVLCPVFLLLIGLDLPSPNNWKEEQHQSSILFRTYAKYSRIMLSLRRAVIGDDSM